MASHPCEKQRPVQCRTRWAAAYVAAGETSYMEEMRSGNEQGRFGRGRGPVLPLLGDLRSEARPPGCASHEGNTSMEASRGSPNPTSTRRSTSEQLRHGQQSLSEVGRVGATRSPIEGVSGSRAMQPRLVVTDGSEVLARAACRAALPIAWEGGRASQMVGEGEPRKPRRATPPRAMKSKRQPRVVVDGREGEPRIEHA
jgi:hypothetical protein